jgi:hypothetical protein
MALAFPLSLAQFADLFGSNEASLFLPPMVQTSRTRGGALIRARLGERLWTGRVVATENTHARLDRLRGRIEVLQDAGGSFLMTPRHRQGPIADPFGVTLGAAVPLLNTIAASRREIRISGLPAGYVLSDGDFLSLTYGSDPLRYWFARVVVGGTADGSGLTPLVEVTPNVPAAISTGGTVTLVRPVFKAVITSASPGVARPASSGGVSFDFIQTFGQ